MILTPKGNVPIETLQINDEIISYVNGKEEIRPVIWAGWKDVTVRPDYPDDQAGYPICILKDAIADNVPYKDMWITAEHCLFLNGKFVPARMLVNTVSIFYDHSITSYAYYHIETEKHAIIMADGVLTESYLDTGNRSAFHSPHKDMPTFIHNRKLTWEHNAAASLEIARAFVEPIFSSILSRASNLSKKNKAYPLYILTTDSAFHLITNTGVVLYPTSIKKPFYTFSLPDQTSSVHLVSRSSRPFDTIGPFVNDRRYLGVLIGKIYLRQFHKTIDINRHFEEKTLHGWHTNESNTHRWTDGNA
ncbi:hypothetical protein COMNV_01132 [Commensalibacter sp. Nvir]|nr:hypothetical protein COMNV_01132 [Commensalibacter sp. Nvir]